MGVQRGRTSPDYGSGGWEFESSRARHYFQWVRRLSPDPFFVWGGVGVAFRQIILRSGHFTPQPRQTRLDPLCHARLDFV
jgi:hypothetical protein